MIHKVTIFLLITALSVFTRAEDLQTQGSTADFEFVAAATTPNIAQNISSNGTPPPAQTSSPTSVPAAAQNTEPIASASAPQTPPPNANASPQPGTGPPSATGPPAKKKSAKERLVEQLTKRNGEPASVVIFGATETTASRLGAEVSRSIENAMLSYGKVNVRREDFALKAITMEEIRTAMARFNADVVLVPVVKPDSVDLFLFDRRTPYNLYAHSEFISPQIQAMDPPAAAREITRLLIRRLLYRYMNKQYFELPREESLPVLQSEIPAWIASPDSLHLVNREITSRFYLSASLGAAVNMARSHQLWNSNLIGLQMGVRLWDKVYLEGQATSFSYNALVGSLRYTFINRDSPFRVNVGLGFAFVTRDKVWNLDQTIGLGRYSYYIVPSGSLLFPIGEVYLKLEGQMFVSPSFNQFIWTFMPGIQVHF